MTRTKKILSLLMALAMLTGLLAVFATTVSAYDEYVIVSCDPITVGTDTSIYPKNFDVGSAQIKSMVRVSGELPPGMCGYYSNVSAFLSDTPTTPGYYTPSYDVTLSNGKVIRLNFYVLVIKSSAKERSETIYLDAMTYQSVYLLHREGIDDSVFTDLYYRAEIVDGNLPRGMKLIVGEADPPNVYGTPECAEQTTATIRTILYDGNVIEDTVKFIVNPVKTIKSDEKIYLEPGKTYDQYLNDKNTDQYRSVSITPGTLPPGMTWSSGEVDGPHVKGTPTKAGMYQTKFTITNFIGEVNEHTVTFVVSGKNPFTDVPSGEYYAESVGWAVNHDPVVTKGTSDTTFSPDDTCTRGQIVTFLWRALGEPEPSTKTNPFADVPATEYYYKAVLWAVENGVTNGVDPTHFGPDQGCTRGQVVTFMHRAFGLPEPNAAHTLFTDVKEDQYYFKPILWAVENGITNGTSPSTFEPNSTCTRGQIVTFLCRGMVPEPKEFPVHVLGDEFLIYVEDVFNVTDRGTVVTGRVTNGKVKTGDKVVVYSWDDSGNLLTIEAEVGGIEMFHKILDEAEKGDNVGLLLGDSSLKDQIQRGSAVVMAGSRLKPYTGNYVGTVYCDPKGRTSPMKQEHKFQYFVATTDVAGDFLDMNFSSFNDARNIYPGETREGVVIELSRPLLVYQGMEISIRAGGRTFGTFTVTGRQR